MVTIGNAAAGLGPNVFVINSDGTVKQPGNEEKEKQPALVQINHCHHPAPSPYYSYYPGYPPYPPQQPSGPTVLVIKTPEPDPPKPPEEDPKPTPPAETPPPKVYENPPFSKFATVSLIFFLLAIVLGFASAGNSYDQITQVDRTATVACGAASLLCFIVATACSFYANRRYKHKADTKEKPCVAELIVIAGVILFCFTTVYGFIGLVIAFDESNPIAPVYIWPGLLGSIAAWGFMFGYAELTRRLCGIEVKKK